MLQTNPFKALRNVHMAMISGLLLFLLLSIIMQETGTLPPFAPSADRILQLVLILCSFVATIAGFNMFKRKIMAARQSAADARDRTTAYTGACLQWWALQDLPAVLALIGFLTTGNYAFVALAVFHLLVLLAFMPRRENIILLLQLSAADVDRLEGRD